MRVITERELPLRDDGKLVTTEWELPYCSGVGYQLCLQTLAILTYLGLLYPHGSN